MKETLQPRYFLGGVHLRAPVPPFKDQFVRRRPEATTRQAFRLLGFET